MVRSSRNKLWVLLVLMGVVAVVGALTVRSLLAGTARQASVPARLAGAAGGDVALKVVGRGFHTVTDIQFVPGSPSSAIVLTKDGKARFVTFSDQAISAASASPLVLEVAVRQNSELGLLGLAFHPAYQKNGLFYLNYNPSGGQQRTRVAEWRVEPKQLGKQRAREVRVLLEVEQPYANHNAGQLAFGPDGMLYIGLGDGGRADDPHKHGQDPSTLLGSMLRIDVNQKTAARPYGIPKNNPFLHKQTVRPEIWAYGLRNPWRYAFDDKGRLIVADVGQDAYEEVHIVQRGDNLGWNQREGRHCLRPGCSSKGFNEPVFEYGRDQGKSITGGYQYAGSAIPKLKGKYLVADYDSGKMWALSLPNSPAGTATSELLGQFRRMITTFGKDGRGEIYAGDFASGEIVKLAPPK